MRGSMKKSPSTTAAITKKTRLSFPMRNMTRFASAIRRWSKPFPNLSLRNR